MAFDTQRGLILAALMDRIRAIQTSAGYHVDVKSDSVVSDPVNVLTIPDPLLPFFLVEISPSSRQFQPANRIQIEAHFLITGRAMATGTSATRKTELGEGLFADLEKTIAADPTLGGLVIDTRVQEPDGPIVGMGANNNVFVVLDVQTTHIRVYGAP